MDLGLFQWSSSYVLIYCFCLAPKATVHAPFLAKPLLPNFFCIRKKLLSLLLPALALLAIYTLVSHFTNTKSNANQLPLLLSRRINFISAFHQDKQKIHTRVYTKKTELTINSQPAPSPKNFNGDFLYA